MGAPPAPAAEENIWRHLLRQASCRSKLPNVNVILAGDRNCGKSMLLKRLSSANINQEDDMGYAPCYTWFDIMDTGDQDMEILSRVGIWSISNHEQLPLIESSAFQPSVLESTIVILAIDLSTPWTIKTTIEKWLKVLHDNVSDTLRKHGLLAQKQKERMVKYLAYEEEGTTDVAAMGENVLIHNCGVPIIIVGCKADESSKDEIVSEYVQYYLRRLCLEYGAGLIFTSAKENINCMVLQRYLTSYHQVDEKNHVDKPQVIDHEALFIPSGYDSYDLIEESLNIGNGAKPKWNPDLEFHQIIPPMKKSVTEMIEEEDTVYENMIKVDEEQEWLEKLQNAGANTASPDRKTRTITEVMQTHGTTQVLEEKSTSTPSVSANKDVNPAHLANFFNNLLTRSEKERKKDSSAKIRQLAKKELGNFK